ncbi:ArsA family ATPase [Nocardia sp. NBC_00508]|uniref:ArsA family ATPase n=1 Tax=Nocardia sp. NBC_00508 TaxID=2975992 RepID=UPI002E805130|nr:ArsA-related P-loop ATPase [Nocardia sp. NBC_00508]WUD67646.1 ArsA family ATPase [Nocardia sp. NBC_00508]
MAEARSGRRVLVASLDQAHSLGDALGFRFAHDPGTVTGVARVLPGLDVIEVDSLALLEDRFRDVVRMISADRGHRHGVDLAALDPAELTGLPGVQELLMLVEIAQFAAEDTWDLIVVDCPPSADMLRIVSAPDMLLGYLERIWPPHARAMSAIGTDLRRAVLAATVERIAKAVTEVRDLLADHRRTGARLVTVAERVAVAESERVRSAAALLGLRLDAVVVNKVLPDLERPAGPAGAEHPAVQWYSSRRGEQADVIAELRHKLPGIPVLIAQHTGAEPIGLNSLAALSYAVDSAGNTRDAALMLSDNQTEVDAGSREPAVRRESGTGLQSVYALRMHLPVVDAATLRLGRVEDDLIVGADGVRRRVRLAPVLRRCTVDGAELDDGYLVVRFRPDPRIWSPMSESDGYDR